MVSKPDHPNAKRDPDGNFIYPELQPQIGEITHAQQARQDQIALAGRAKLASLCARLEAVRIRPEPEPKGPAEARGLRHALPAVIPPQPPPASWSDLLTVMNNQHAIIDNVGGKTVIASWEPSSLDPTREIVAFQKRELPTPLFQPFCKD